MVFESVHSFDDNEFIQREGKNLNCKMHIHRSFEFFKLLNGISEVVIDDKIYTLRRETQY